MRRQRIVGAGLALAAATGIAGTLTVLPAAAEDHESAIVDWGACPEDVPGADRLECASIAVPLDYDELDAATIDVMISRVAGTVPDERRGVLMLNPGGPGGQGLSQPTDLIDLGLPNDVTNAYDLIGMDPRGVGHSTPVSCGFTVEQGHRGNVPPYATDEADVAEQAETAKAIADQCAVNDPDGLMRHMTTANTARDMDFIRAALGEDRISFFGASYGSALGAAYASMFPEQSDRIVLDSNLGATALDWDAQRRWGPGFEEGFPTYAAWLAERHAGYGLGETADEVRDNYFALAERLDAAPLAEFDGKTFRMQIFATLYKERNYAPTARIWQALADADGAEAGRLLEESQPSAPADSGTELSPYDNAWSSYLAVTCNDTEWPEDLATYQVAVEADREAYPMFGAAAANITPCAFWPNDPAEPQVPIDDEGPANVLVVQNERDNATPLAGGVLLREAFGDRARLVTVDGDGHGVYVYGDNPCALNFTTQFLLDGELPASDVYCEASTASGLELDDAGEERREDVFDRITQ